MCISTHSWGRWCANIDVNRDFNVRHIHLSTTWLPWHFNGIKWGQFCIYSLHSMVCYAVYHIQMISFFLVFVSIALFLQLTEKFNRKTGVPFYIFTDGNANRVLTVLINVSTVVNSTSSVRMQPVVSDTIKTLTSIPNIVIMCKIQRDMMKFVHIW